MDRIPIIAGPTASGKTDLVLALSGRIDGLAVVSADSRQVYRRLDVGTAKPTATERARVPHRLIDSVEPDETYSAGRFRTDAETAIADLLARGARPIVVGGTGFYFRALTAGLSPIPPVPDEVAARVRGEIAEEGLPALYRRLREVDPIAAAGIRPNDPQRTARALAVYEATGRPLSAWWAVPTVPPRYQYAWLGLRWSRDRLRERIVRRTDAMLAAGLEREVRSLVAAGYSWESNALRTVGYREWRGYLSGEATLLDVRRRIVERTGQYAKRQMTWFVAVREIAWIDAESADFFDGARAWIRDAAGI